MINENSAAVGRKVPWKSPPLKLKHGGPVFRGVYYYLPASDFWRLRENGNEGKGGKRPRTLIELDKEEFNDDFHRPQGVAQQREGPATRVEKTASPGR